MKNNRKDVEMVCAWGENENVDYDPELCRDGGGYWQPCGGVMYKAGNKLFAIHIEDLSCGVYGSRIYITIETKNRRWFIRYGTFISNQTPRDEFNAIIKSASGSIGVKNMISAIIYTLYVVRDLSRYNYQQELDE